MISTARIYENEHQDFERAFEYYEAAAARGNHEGFTKYKILLFIKF